jgi:hypothetical protein
MSYLRLVMRSYHCTTMARIFVCGSGEAHRYLAPKASITCADPARLTLVMRSYHCTTKKATSYIRLVMRSLHCTIMARISCAGPAWLTDIRYSFSHHSVLTRYLIRPSFGPHSDTHSVPQSVLIRSSFGPHSVLIRSSFGPHSDTQSDTHSDTHVDTQSALIRSSFGYSFGTSFGPQSALCLQGPEGMCSFAIPVTMRHHSLHFQERDASHTRLSHSLLTLREEPPRGSIVADAEWILRGEPTLTLHHSLRFSHSERNLRGDPS